MYNIVEQVRKFWMILTFLIGASITLVKTNTTIDHRLEQLEKHAMDTNKHWTTEKKVEYFVPRKELDQRFDNVEKLLEKIDKKLN